MTTSIIFGELIKVKPSFDVSLLLIMISLVWVGTKLGFIVKILETRFVIWAVASEALEYFLCIPPQTTLDMNFKNRHSLSPRLWKSTTGLSKAQFDILANKFQNCYEEHHKSTLTDLVEF